MDCYKSIRRGKPQAWPAPSKISIFDTMVIGSGISGLTAASLLAKLKGEKVLLLEQHNIIGGFTHTFRRGRFEWDTGLHYVGNMGPSDFPRKIMDFVTGHEVDWLKMPDTFELFHFPTFKFAQRAGEDRFRQDLKVLFPTEAEAIDRYFEDLLKVQIWGTLQFAAQILPWTLAWIPRLAALVKATLGEGEIRRLLPTKHQEPRIGGGLSGALR